MAPDWNQLPDEMQIALSREALHRAAATIATQAELLAEAMEAGELADRGGPDALRLFAAVVRTSDGDDLAPRGMAEPVIPWPSVSGDVGLAIATLPGRRGSRD